MKKYFTGLMMAWGNFCTVPCPKKLWDSRCQSLMLGFLPTVGLVIGLLWASIYFGLVYLAFPFLAVSFIVTFLPYGLSGFIHLDGFMDCNDAILSRRPLEDRQRILKDSHTGAFAVISVVLLILGAFSFMSTSISLGIDFVNLVLIAILSRSVAALEVLSSSPMKTSQYRIMSEGEDECDSKDKCEGKDKCEDAASCGSENNSSDSANDDSASTSIVSSDSTCEADDTQKPVSRKTGIITLSVQLVLYLVLGFVFSSFYAATALVSGTVIITSLIAIRHGKKQLGGMNGDIAGYGIVWGELFGIFALMLC